MKRIWEDAEDYAFAKIAGKKRPIHSDVSFKEANKKYLIDDYNIDCSLKRFLNDFVVSEKEANKYLLLKILIRYEVDTQKIDDIDEEIQIVENMLNGNDTYTKKNEEKDFLKTVSLLSEDDKEILLANITSLIKEYK